MPEFTPYDAFRHIAGDEDRIRSCDLAAFMREESYDDINNLVAYLSRATCYGINVQDFRRYLAPGDLTLQKEVESRQHSSGRPLPPDVIQVLKAILS